MRKTGQMLSGWRAVCLGLAMLLICAPASLAGGGGVAVQSADSSCANDSGDIYVDCGNGTVTDNRTGLVWLKNADCLDVVTWYEATDFVAGLSDLPGSDLGDCGLEDGSAPGEWRLPSKAEWEVMTGDASALNCQPLITNDRGNDCWSRSCNSAECAFTGVQSSFYWSATTIATAVETAWGGRLVPTTGIQGPKAGQGYVWPVRGGQ